jgi:hypothetical protein
MTDETIPMDRLAKVYIKIRNKKAELTRLYEQEVLALDDQIAQLSSVMKEQLRAMDILSAKTEYGTVSLVTKTKYIAQDRDAFKAFVLEHAAIDLLEMRIAQVNMKKFLDENPGTIPVGLNVLSEVAVVVRKPSAVA